MLCSDDRSQLRSACSLFGGIRAVAQRAGIDDGNLSKWLRGGSTLSDANVERVLAVLGLPNGEPDTDYVHTWEQKKHVDNLKSYLGLYFPNGAEIAHAPWAKPGFENLKNNLGMGNRPDAVYALTDGCVRGVYRMRKRGILGKANIKPHFTWKGGSFEAAILNISGNDPFWMDGTPTIEEFDTSWFGKPIKASEKGVIKAIHQEGISFDEAIKRIRLAGS